MKINVNHGKINMNNGKDHFPSEWKITDRSSIQPLPFTSKEMKSQQVK